MPVIFAREAPKLWRKVCAETSTEISLLAGNWKYFLAGLVFQYLHGLAAHGVHYLHRPGPTLQDAGFFFLPELGQDRSYLSLSNAPDYNLLLNSASWSKLSLPRGLKTCQAAPSRECT